MLFTENLEEIIFNRHQLFQTDEFIVVSGYLGPKPVQRLHTLPFNTRVIYGMYGSDGIQTNLHDALIKIQNQFNNINIFYSDLPVHSKCYVWRNNGQIIHALVGSANFSTNGLTTPFREILAETTFDTFKPLNDYINRILQNSYSCLEIVVVEKQGITNEDNECKMSLLMDDGQTHNASGLNWGYMANGQPAEKRGINDACIPIRIEHLRIFPDLFPQKQIYPIQEDGRGRAQRHNDAIEILWDDGMSMEGLLEGSQPLDTILYPKQISSFPSKSQMGEYLRNRIGVPLGQPVRRFHLDKYGRTDISVSKIGDGIYKFDFSVK